jgi:hypothetical protein
MSPVNHESDYEDEDDEEEVKEEGGPGGQMEAMERAKMGRLWVVVLKQACQHRRESPQVGGSSL